VNQTYSPHGRSRYSSNLNQAMTTEQLKDLKARVSALRGYL
jgi:hypothetical protein